LDEKEEKEESMRSKICTMAIGLAGVLTICLLGASQVAAFPTAAAAIKAAVPDNIIDVRAGPGPVFVLSDE
jgi:hypothetical protein